ncbi:MAG TPA: hypothetical protein VNW54_14850 [Granulicella sp.]|jgi:hypothetical protein|nr:hypothetical protein [Granulicella sp.]
MKRTQALALAIPLIALVPTITRAHAQNQPIDAVRTQSAATLYAIPDSTGCPIGLRAQRESSFGSVIVKDGQHHEDGQDNKGGEAKSGIAQRLHMTVTNSNPRQIVGIQITVHGFAAKARITPTVSAQLDTSELKRSIDLKLSVGANQRASTDLRLSQFTSVSLLDIDAVDYADGSSWHPSSQQTCHIAPDGIMLVSSR